jgi:hypothetical protein
MAKQTIANFVEKALTLLAIATVEPPHRPAKHAGNRNSVMPVTEPFHRRRYSFGVWTTTGLLHLRAMEMDVRHDGPQPPKGRHDDHHWTRS